MQNLGHVIRDSGTVLPPVTEACHVTDAPHLGVDDA